MISTAMLALLVSQYRPEQFGAHADCVSDDRQPIIDAINAACGSAGDVFLSGCYHLSNTLSIPCSVHLRGTLGILGRTRLHFPRDKAGVIFSSAAKGSVAEDFEVQGGGGTDPSAHGIAIQTTNVMLRSIKVHSFAGNGVNLDCRLQANTNCNATEMDAVIVEQCSGWGVHTNGPDSNGGTFVGLDLHDNALGCVLEESFLGNTYVGGHCDSATQFAFGARSFVQLGLSAFTQIVGMYFEGPGEIYLDSISATLFGVKANSVTGRGTAIGANTIRNARWIGKLGLNAAAAHAHVLEIENYAGTLPLYLDYEFNEPRAWQWQIGNSAPVATIGDAGHSELARGQIAFGSPIGLGSPGNRRTVWVTDGPPTVACRSGDFRTNIDVRDVNSCGAYVCRRDGQWACIPLK